MNVDTIWPADTDEERELKRQLADLRAGYMTLWEEESKPIMDRLLAIQATKIPIGHVYQMPYHEGSLLDIKPKD